MKAASGALVSLLNSRADFVMADLYTFTLIGGQILYFSGGPDQLIANGRTYIRGPKFERSRTKLVIGTQVDQLEIKVYPEPSDQQLGNIWPWSLWQGALDGALVQLERAFMPTWGDTSAGTVILFAGRVAECEFSRTMVDLKVASYLELLNIQMPRRLWQALCGHVFGSPMCGFNRFSMAVDFAYTTGNVVVLGGVPVTGKPLAYIGGTVQALSGQNYGVMRTITNWSDGQALAVQRAFPYTPAVGDVFQALPGCDKSLPTCENTFNNGIHFGGFPYIPTAETGV
jgi:uncharacterized phage protein (TIGR02218 family)